MRGSPTRLHSRPIWRHCARSIGWSTPRSRSLGPGRCCAICRATPTALRSPIAGSCPPTRTASPSSTRTIGSKAPPPHKTMTLATDEFIRRFLIHVLTKGFHRIRHYGLLANGNRSENIAHARELLAAPARPKETETPEAALEQSGVLPQPCPCCGGRMIVIETFARGCEPKHRPTPPPAAIRIDTS